MTNVPENPSISLSNNKNHESSINISDNSQLKVESIPNNNNNSESSKTSIEIQANYSTPNQLSDEMTNAMSKLSTHDKRMANRSNSNPFHQNSNYSYRNSAPMSSHFSSTINPRETDARLAAFTPPLMSLQLSYPQSATYQRNYRSSRPYIQPQRFSLSTKTKSETRASHPEYYVDSFASNFSSTASSNTNNDKKVKHVTFQEPDNESLKSNSNDSTVSPSSSNGLNYSSSSTWTSSVPMYSNSNPYSPYDYSNYQYSYNEFHPQYSNVMTNQFYATRSRRMNMISTPSTWQTHSYFPHQPTQYMYHPPQSRQLYDPNKPKMPSTFESRDSSKVVRHIAPKNKKRVKETNTNDNSVVSTPEPITHPITILRKPSADTEVNVLSVENQLVFSPLTEEEQQQQQQQQEISTFSDIVSKEEQQPTISSDAPFEEQQPTILSDVPFEEQQPINSSNSPSEKEEKTISSISNQSESNSTISFPTDELLSILQSANYISSLNEYAQQKKFSLNYEFSSISPSSFTCIISINGRQFPPSPTCLSKNEAQKLACDQALRILYRESCPNEQSSFEFSSKHDYIAHRSISTFQQLNVNDLLLGRKTLACILMTTNQQFEQARVISIATGNSCLDQTNLGYADNGKALHDCHAEILARRGLIKYLFEQIKQSKDNKSSIFQYNSTNNKYELDETITFHMYISSLPCGNASLNISSNSLRYKQDQTEGTLLASTSTIKFPIKSCSDKICRWNILGIQGGLLINFLTKPIYLQTITIACETTFDRNHVKYSLYERLKEYLQSIPSPFIFHIPDIDCPQMKSFQQERKVAKLQTNAFAWNITQPDRTELLEPRTGKLKNDRSISSLSKQNLFQDFQKIFQDNSLTYQQAKQLNQTYVSIKNLISTAFQTGSSDANISWISKSDQLEQFSIQ